MYSGTTFTKASGRILGAHQKIDRSAEKQLRQVLKSNQKFPSIKQILSFEGHNGPDAIKRKSPSKDEPWHFFNPRDNTDTNLLDIIQSHYDRLVESIRQKDEIRQAFEAAWLAHALVDGMTPAHHFPYAEKVIELSENNEDPSWTIKDKLLLPGATVGKVLLNNWKFWGPKGLLTTHMGFEMGVAMLIKPLKISKNQALSSNLELVSSTNLKSWYRDIAILVQNMGLYDTFYEKGWSSSLARQIKRELFPVIVRSVAMVWYGAVEEAATKSK